jgi:murein DD-endopeptidase MepM/ murein hydrolase activator NlpD
VQRVRAIVAVAALGLLGGCVAGGAQGPARAPAAGAERPEGAWRPRPVVADANRIEATTVTVRPGETLARVAERTGSGAFAIAVANGLAPGAQPRAGQTLRIPGGRYHSVKPGETGLAIARAYRTDWRMVVLRNGLAAPYTLEVGDRLLIPPAPTLEERAAANRLDIDELLRGDRPARPRQAGRAAAPPPPAATAAAPRRGAPPAVTAPAPRLDWPLEGRILSTFGRKPGGRFNDGVNIAAVAGAAVRAAADGEVLYAGTGVAAFGGLILIRHEGGWVTAYAHNATLLVARGARVTRGQTIARAGATGAVTEPQLHFELRQGRTPVDPLPHLPRRALSMLGQPHG